MSHLAKNGSKFPFYGNCFCFWIVFVPCKLQLKLSTFSLKPRKSVLFNFYFNIKTVSIRKVIIIIRVEKYTGNIVSMSIKFSGLSFKDICGNQQVDLTHEKLKLSAWVKCVFFLLILFGYTSECWERNSRTQRKTGEITARLNCWFSCGLYWAFVHILPTPFQDPLGV